MSNSKFMSQEEYSAISGSKTAELDIAEGRPGFHRTLSNSPDFRAAYDSVIQFSRAAVRS